MLRSSLSDVTGNRQLDFRILGSLEVWVEGRQLPLAAAKERALLAILLLHANEVVSSDRLVDDLWGEVPPRGAGNTLQVYVSKLRKSLQGEGGSAQLLVTRSPGYVLTVGVDELDLSRFERLVQEGERALAGGQPDRAAERLGEALSLWRGPPLADFAFEAFAQAAIARLDELRLAALEARIEADLALGGHAGVVGELETLVAAHPLRERLRAQLMLALYRSGRQAEALAAYQEARQVLVEELGLEPSQALKELEAAILRQDPALMLEPPELRARRHLPTAPNALVGRERELDELAELVASPGTRLVSLTGPGGIGKTRLALAAAGRLAGSFGDGVWFVGLAPIADPALVLSSIAQALGVQERPEELLAATLASFLEDKELLLVVDNFEHLLEAATELSDLLREAPRLKLLLTSRVRLDLYGEHGYEVPPLGVPDAGLEDVEALERHDAVALFLDRARAARRDFALTGGSAGAVAQVCIALDGLPLALELAAARLRTLSPEELVGGLSRRLDLLTGGPRDVTARQQTLRATIAWSHELLNPAEQALFRRLSVFAGGCGADAAEAVCYPDGELGLDALDGLQALVEQSLLTRAPDPEQKARFRMLETIREYAAERLEAEDEADQVRRRHAEFFLALAETAEPELTESTGAVWSRRLAVEHDNLRAALRTTQALGEAEVALRLAASLWRFWRQHSYVAEGRAWLATTLAGADALPAALRAKALNGAGVFAIAELDAVAGRALEEESLQLFEQVGDRRGMAMALGDLSTAAMIEGDYDRTVELATRAMSYFDELGEEWAVVVTLLNIGSVRRYQGDLGEAGRLHDEALERAASLGNDNQYAAALAQTGLTKLASGEVTLAGELFRQGLALANEHEDWETMADCIGGLAAVSVARGAPSAGARLGGLAEAIRQAWSVPARREDAAVAEPFFARARRELGDAAFSQAWEEGRASEPDEAVVELLSSDALPKGSPPGSG